MKFEIPCVVDSISVGVNRGEGCVMVRVHDVVDRKEDGVESVHGADDILLRLHTKDGQPPFKLGQTIRITVDDEL